jgi:hypothetical protein
MFLIGSLLFIGCFEPTTTSKGGMTGTIHFASGDPVTALSISTVEARATTDDRGHFAVEYQEPATYIDFRQGSTLYQRHYRDADEGQQLALRLPESRDAVLRCDGAVPCMALLTWNLADGLIGRTTVRCEPGKRIELSAIPASPPQANCQQIITEPPSPIEFADNGDTLTVGDPIYTFSVSLIRPDGKPARPCGLTINGERIRRDPNALFPVTASGTVTVQATCGQRKLPSQEYTVERNGLLTIEIPPESSE